MKNLIIALSLIFVAKFVWAQTAKEYTQTGRELIEKREYMEAILNLNKAIEVDPTYASAYYLRGNLKESFEDQHGAMKDYN
ncbi:MAG: tetratricopeptide repeat protein [Flammeovirgaceae bacterium]|nr:tetratricopeptide repeat protein [Flammeovirgaceae bacterium]